VQALPSLHGIPFALFGFVQTPVEVLQVPATWHWSSAVHVTAVPGMHAPEWQVSLVVHALPSVHDAPSAFAGFEQTPVLGLQTPTAWHWSWAVHVTGLAPVHTPPTQVSLCVQALPSLHEVPSERFW
jgi:hypothetical protein